MTGEAIAIGRVPNLKMHHFVHECNSRCNIMGMQGITSQFTLMYSKKNCTI